MSTDQRGIIHWFNPSLTTFDMTPEMRDHLEALTTARLMSPDDPNYMPVYFVPAPRFDLLDFVIQVLNQLFGTRIRQAIKAIRTYMTDRKLRNDVDETTELAESVSKRLRDTWGLDAIDTAEINLVVRQEIDRIQKKRGDAWSTHPMLSTCGMCMQIGRKNCTCPCHADDVAAGSGKSVEI